MLALNTNQSINQSINQSTTLYMYNNNNNNNNNNVIKLTNTLVFIG